MRRVDAGLLVLVAGGLGLWMGLTRTSLLYVRPGTRPLLVVAGAVLLAIGLTRLLLDRRALTADHEDHHRVGRVAWLLVLPVVVAVAVGSNPLGSYAAGRQNSQRTLPAGSFDLEAYLNANSFGGQAPALRVLDFIRSAEDPATRDLLAGTSVTLQGFVTEDVDGRFLLTRFTIGCCAADAIAMFVEVDPDGHEVPPVDTWVEVVGELVPGSHDPPVVRASGVRSVDAPGEVYEYPP